MTSKKTTRRALLTSVMALILCCAMLVGSTFAWFTDSVESANNIIKSGNLDVEVYNGLDASATNLEKVEKLFSKVKLWEPGVVAYENLTVANVGTLALKYIMNVNFTEENTLNGKGLSDVLKVAVVDGGVKTDDRDALIASINNWQTMADFEKNGELYPADSTEGENTTTYGLVIYWEPSDNDNDWNVNNGKETSDKQPLHITLGINLLATQMEAEFDSFGNDYDKDAIYADVYVSTGEELIEALANVKDGAIIGIRGNVTWTTGAGHDSTPFVTEAKSITLLGVDEDSTFTAVGSGVGPVGIYKANDDGTANDGTVTFKNLKIVDESVSYNEGAWELGYLEFRGNTVFENCDVVNAIMMEGQNAKFVNCSFNSHDDNQYAVWVSNGNATFENCYITGARGLKTHEAYGSEVGTIVINNNQFVDLTKKPGLAIGTVNADTTIVLTNNTFAGTQAGDQGNFKYETDTDVTTFNFTDKDNFVAGYADDNQDLKDQLKNGATVIVPAGTYTLPSLTGKEDITIIGAADGSTVFNGVNSFGFGTDTVIKNVTFKGGNAVRYGYTHGDVVFENCVFEGETYGFHVDNANDGTITFNGCTFKGFNAFAATGTYYFNKCSFEYSGSQGHTNMWGTGTFTDCTWGDATSVGRGGSYPGTGKVVIDGEDIGYQRDFIGSAKSLRSFRSEVDENGCKKDQSYVLVADIDLDGTYWYPIKGAFAGTFDGNGYTIKNMDLAHEYITSTSNVGFFTKISSTAVIKNVTFDNAKVYGTHYVGVILGWEGNETANATIDNCHVINSTITCDTDANSDNGDKAGGICGYAVTLNITNCSVKDTTIKAYRDFGGIIGYANSKVVVKGNTVENVTLVIDNDVNYKNYTTDAEHDANPVVGEAVSTAVVEDNTVK